MMKSVAQLSQEIDDTFTTKGVGVGFLEKFRDPIQSIDPVELLTHFLPAHDRRRAYNFLLCAPYVWEWFSPTHWTKLHRGITPRPRNYIMDTHTGAYADVCFLLRYLRVSPLPSILNDPQIRGEDKAAIVEYLRRGAAEHLMPDPLDDDDLDGEYWMHGGRLQQVSERLVSEGYPPAPASLSEMRQMIAQLP